MINEITQTLLFMDWIIWHDMDFEDGYMLGMGQKIDENSYQEITFLPPRF